MSSQAEVWPPITELEKCPACGWGIHVVLKGKVRRCCKCWHEWPEPQEEESKDGTATTTG
jgi:hypothetical protein